MKTLITVVCILAFGVILIVLQYGWRSTNEGFSKNASIEFAAQAIDRKKHLTACGGSAYKFQVISKSGEAFVFDASVKASSNCPKLNVIVDRTSGEVWVKQRKDSSEGRNGTK